MAQTTGPFRAWPGTGKNHQVVPDRAIDPSLLYEEERRAFVARLRRAPIEHLSRTVPATPAWSVGDVLAHVVGITADLNAQRFGDGDGDAWTDAQVSTRRGRSIDDLAAEWDREAPIFEEGLRLFGYQFGAHYLGDLLQHTCDVEAALGRSPVRDDGALTVALDFYLDSLDDTLHRAGVGALTVRVGDESWTLGTGDVVASVRASAYELFRALGGRRSLDEIAALEWSGDSDRFAGLLSRYPAPQHSLGES